MICKMLGSFQRECAAKETRISIGSIKEMNILNTPKIENKHPPNPTSTTTDQIGLKTSLDKWPSLGQTGSDFAETVLWIFVRLKFLTS